MVNYMLRNFYSELERIANNHVWYMYLMEDGLHITLLSFTEPIEDIDEDLDELLYYLPPALSGSVNNGEIIIVGSRTNLINFYNDLIAEDREGKGGEFNGGYISYWIDRREWMQ